MQNSEFISVGTISGVFGVKGWVKVFSHTRPRENILEYSPWILRKNDRSLEIKVTDGQRHGDSVIAELDTIADRDAAAALMGSEILILRTQLPKTKTDEYYWADLVGLKVETEAGIHLGSVDYLLETGANDVLVIVDGERERLIPFVQQHTVLNIDLENRVMTVDWDPDF